MAKKVTNPEGRPMKYPQTTIDWIVANISKRSHASIEVHLKMTGSALRCLLCRLRTKGYPIPSKRGGAVKSKLFVSAGVKPPKEDKRTGPKHQETDQHMRRKPSVENTGAIHRQPVFPTIKIDTSNMIKVVFGDKNHTTIYCRDSEHEIRVRKKYAYLEKDLLSRI